MFNGKTDYTEILEMPTDFRRSYAQYVSKQYEARKKSLERPQKLSKLNHNRNSNEKT